MVRVYFFSVVRTLVHALKALQYTQSANLLCAIALHDFIAGNKANEAAAANPLETVFQLHPGYYQPP